MTKTLYSATSKYVKEINNLPVKRQVSVSGILKKLGVSRSGYNAWKKRFLSDTSVRRTVLKEKIQKIYDAFHQNYGSPKITVELRKSGECVAEKTVGNYMRQMGIKAQWVKPYTQTTIDSDLSPKLQNIPNKEFNPEMLYGALILRIFGRLKDLYILQALWIYIPEKSFPGF